ncbi:MAG: DNA translocase FtsK, partial [Phycisphaerae bacterium]
KEKIYERFAPANEQEKLQIPTHLPYIVIIIDELADLMMTCGKEVEHHLSRLAQKSRAVGVHLIVATQRPQANVVTGLIKSNLPCRMAFRVSSRMDSRIVLDQNGADVLMGEGDLLFLPPGQSKLIRSQGTFVEDDELRAVIQDLASKAEPQFHHELQRLRPDSEEGMDERDPLFDKAVDLIVHSKRGSVSLLQRRLEIGYSRASRLIEQMSAAGLVGEYKGSQAREVLITEREWKEIRKQRDREMEEEEYRADLDAEEDGVYGTAGLEAEDNAVPDLIDDRADLRD